MSSRKVSNKWLNHVARFRRENPQIKSNVLKLASKTYRKQHGGAEDIKVIVRVVNSIDGLDKVTLGTNPNSADIDPHDAKEETEPMFWPMNQPLVAWRRLTPDGSRASMPDHQFDPDNPDIMKGYVIDRVFVNQTIEEKTFSRESFDEQRQVDCAIVTRVIRGHLTEDDINGQIDLIPNSETNDNDSELYICASFDNNTYYVEITYP